MYPLQITTNPKLLFVVSSDYELFQTPNIENVPPTNYN